MTVIDAASSMTDPEQLARTVRTASRTLARHGLVHAYGHCSARVDADCFVVSPPKPLGQVEVGEACVLVSLEGALPDDVLGEVRIHREIYRRRPDVRGVVRCMPPKIMSLGAMGSSPRARHGFGAYFFPEPPLWRDPQLLRSDVQAARLAERFGAGRAILMRGNGAVTAGSSLEEAVVLAWYLEDAARVELDCLGAGRARARALTSSQAQERATWEGRIRERMWSYLTHGDPER